MTPVAPRTAAIVTVGSEIVDGIGLDTNTQDIARAVSAAGYRVSEAASVADDCPLLAATINRLTELYSLVITTGGLGPTHDDITREAAADALGRPLVESPDLLDYLEPISRRHTDPAAARQVFRQAQLLEGAQIITPTSGTAPGQIIETDRGLLVLLPGPPGEMRPMLDEVLEKRGTPVSRILSCVGVTESDAQVTALRAISGIPDVGLTVLATLGEVRVVLLDHGAGAQQLDRAANKCSSALGLVCHSTLGETLAETVVRLLRSTGRTVTCAESCTGGLISSRLTEIPGASAVFLGSAITYSNAAKCDVLGVSEKLIELHGAVSEPVAREMAEGARTLLDSDIAVSVTGIAGPTGGSDDKPVGLVWFAVADGEQVTAERVVLPGDRTTVRLRATVRALNLVRLAILKSTPT